MVSEPIRVALIVAEALEACRVRYLVGGSLASAVSGEPRSTLDVDLVVELTEKHVEPLAAALGVRFHVDADALRRAIRERSSTNVIHLDKEQMDRRQHVQVSTNPNGWLYIYTPEDILLQKLRWYRMGNEVSDRQWRDIMGIVLVQEDRLDRTYLQHGAEALGVSDLLQRALGEALGDSPSEPPPTLE